MGFFLVCMGLFLGSRQKWLLDFSADVAMGTQSFCQTLIPNGPFFQEHAAIVCGKNLTNSDLKTDLQVSGLIHIVVVSASHLVFLGQIFTKVPKPFRWAIFVGFCFLTGFQPPVVRSLLQLFVSEANRHYRLGLSGDLLVLLSGLIGLLLFPQWTSSISLLLSWACGLALATEKRTTVLSRALRFYVLLFPFLLPISVPDPLSILLNAFVAPLISLGLFPISLFTTFAHFAQPLSDYLWAALAAFLKMIAPFLSSSAPVKISLSTLWGILLTYQWIIRCKALSSPKFSS